MRNKWSEGYMALREENEREFRMGKGQVKRPVA